MPMRNAGIIHYALFCKRNNGLQCACFVDNGLRSGFLNRRFLYYFYNVSHIFYDDVLRIFFILFKGGHFNECTKGTLNSRTPNTSTELSVISFADSLNLNFLVYFAEIIIKLFVYEEVNTHEKFRKG